MRQIDDEIIELLLNVINVSRYIPDSNEGNNRELFVGQYRCLFLLEKKQATSQKELADTLRIRPASLSELLHKLEEKDYIVRTQSEWDRRVLLVSLTELGVEKIKHIRERRSEVHSDILSVLSEEEKQTFYDILLKITEKRSDK